VYSLLAGNPKEKRPIGRPRRRWVDNIKWISVTVVPTETRTENLSNACLEQFRQTALLGDSVRVACDRGGHVHGCTHQYSCAQSSNSRSQRYQRRRLILSSRSKESGINNRVIICRRRRSQSNNIVASSQWCDIKTSIRIGEWISLFHLNPQQITASLQQLSPPR
jgi:hypothetical protein